MTFEGQVQAAIRTGDVKACRKLLAGKSEKERTALSGTILKTFDLAHGLIFSRDPSRAEKKLGVDGAERDLRYAILEAARIALLRTVTNVEPIKKYVWRSIPKEDDDVVAALKDRPRELVSAWIAQICEHTPSRWWAARLVVTGGLCDRPMTDGYVLGMIHAAADRFSTFQKNGKSLFVEDPDLLGEEIWRIFEVEGNRDVSLTGYERTWREILLDLVAKRKLDRARLLDAALSALSRDFAQHKAGFYSRLHDALRPTPAEMARRARSYVELLASRISPTVALATRVLESLPEDVALDVPTFANAATTAARSAKGQSTALVLLRLLERHRADPDALEAVVAFLEHGAVVVIDAAMAILEGSKPSSALVERVAGLVAAIPASRRARLSAFVVAQGGAQNEKESGARRPKKETETTLANVSPADGKLAQIAALTKAPAVGPWPRVTLDKPAPRLDQARRVVPIADLTELFAVAARTLEEPNDRVAYERVLDGVSRLGVPLSALPADATKPLAKRAAKLHGRRSHAAVELLKGWLAGEEGQGIESKYVNTKQFGMRRVKEVLARLARGESRSLLSMPSTETFFLDPRELASRVKAQTGELAVADTVTALLRLAPEHRKQALTMLTDAKGPAGAAVRHALGGDRDRPDRKQPALWSAATCARSGDPARIAFHWKKTVTGATSSWAGLHVDFAPTPPKLAEISPDAYTVMLATSGDAGHGAQFGDEASVREMASIYPSDRRTFLAHGAHMLAANVAWNGAEWGNYVFIEALLDPDVPLDDVGLMLLAIALNTKEARENALATDALVAAISDGRIVGAELGPPMAFFWDPMHDEVRWSNRPTAGRWAKTLGAVAQTSALHAEVVRRILESFFGVPPAAPPPDVNTLLQLWLDLAVEANVAVPDPDVFAKYTGKAKKIASQLLALQGTRSAHADEAHALALEGRRARASRYTTLRTRWSTTSG